MKGSISPKNVNDIVLQEAIDILDARTKETGNKAQFLEIGSGAGVFIEHLKNELDNRNIPCELESGDIEPEQVNSRNIGITCKFLDAQQEFSLGKKYDLIIAIELIEHIENPFHFIREISKHLSPDGQVILTSPNILSLRSRFRFFMSGCFDYFRRPYNEYWLNMGHVNPINPLQLIYILRKNGFEPIKVMSNVTTLESILLLPFAPLIFLYSFFHYIGREKGKQQKTRNKELAGLILSPAMLLGKTAIYRFQRKREILATPDTWHRGDDGFLP